MRIISYLPVSARIGRRRLYHKPRGESVLLPNLIAAVVTAQQISEAELGRRLGVDRARLWQWKTYRRRMPTRAVYQLATMAGVNVANAVGQYAVEWESRKGESQ